MAETGRGCTGTRDAMPTRSGDVRTAVRHWVERAGYDFGYLTPLDLH
jgi:hypothetical protein